MKRVLITYQRLVEFETTETDYHRAIDAALRQTRPGEDWTVEAFRVEELDDRGDLMTWQDYDRHRQPHDDAEELAS